MFRIRHLTRIAGALALAVVLASCTDAPAPTSVAPNSSAPNTSLLGDLTSGLSGTVSGLLTCNVTERHAASQTIGPMGGVLRVGPHSLTVPQGALSEDVTISAVAPKGSAVIVQFEPEGLRFQRSTALKLSYQSCGLLARPLILKVVYVDENAGSILEVLPSVVNVFTRSVTGKLDHFSNYAIAE